MRAPLVSSAVGWIRPGLPAALALAMATHVMLPVRGGAQEAYTYTVIEHITAASLFPPSINAAGQVALTNDDLVIRNDGINSVTLYDRPSGETRPEGDVSINANGTVVFFSGGGPLGKLWIGQGSGPATVFAQTGNGWALGRHPSINDSGQVVFEAFQGSTRYIVMGNQFSVVAGPGQMVSGETIRQVASPVINNVGQVAFKAQLKPLEWQIVRYTNGQLEALGVPTGTPAPFSMNDSGVVAYYSNEIPQKILTSDGRKIATQEPGFVLDGTFMAINGAGAVAFMVAQTPGIGADRVMIGNGTSVREVLRVGKTVPGLGQVLELFINHFSINDAGQVAILVKYYDGADKYAMIRAEPALDTTDPEIEVPDNIIIDATGPDGAMVEFDVTATDTNDPNPTIECDPASATMFPIGTTTVTCTATDASGNDASASFQVTVVDSSFPTLTVPGPPTAEATSANGAIVFFDVSASDPGRPDPVVTCAPASGSLFPLGMTTVTCWADNAAGNRSTASFTVTVRDTTAPSLTVPQGLVLDAFSNNQLAYIVTATDAVDPSPVISCSPPPGSTLSVGRDVVVTCTATDAFGNDVSASFTVEVLSLSDLLLRMIRAIEAMDLITGLKQTLIMHLQSANATLGNVTTPPFHRSACPHLNVFRAQLAAAVHTGAMTDTAGAPLVQDATNIWSFLGCVHGYVLR